MPYTALQSNMLANIPEGRNDKWIHYGYPEEISAWQSYYPMQQPPCNEQQSWHLSEIKIGHANHPGAWHKSKAWRRRSRGGKVRGSSPRGGRGRRPGPRPAWAAGCAWTAASPRRRRAARKVTEIYCWASRCGGAWRLGALWRPRRGNYLVICCGRYSGRLGVTEPPWQTHGSIHFRHA